MARGMLAVCALMFVSACAHAGFIKVKGTHFELDGAPYYYVGANFWYGMSLGTQGNAQGRERLVRELDRLKRLGVTNLRVLGASEGPDGEPWRISPAMQSDAGIYRESHLLGLDFLLSEMKKRGMRAVVCLNNFWPWSGGMSQYLAWAGAGAIPYPPPHPGGDWNVYQAYTQRFYSNEKAVYAFNELVRALVTRVNAYTSTKYSEDPTIMAWQLANEPRGVRNVEAFNRWIESTAYLIKTLDHNHLVTTGSEGETPWPSSAGLDFIRNHAFRDIDYATAHVWVTNWGYFDPERPDLTYDMAVSFMGDYLQKHATMARKLGKPLVIEEFGIGRDGGSYDSRSSTTIRDRYYRDVFEQVYRSARSGGPIAGVNFWAWAGEGYPARPGDVWRRDDPFTGDPPHELQGWYSVYERDASTQSVISEYASKMTALKGRRP